MLGLAVWDWVVIGAYLLGITLLGVWMMLRVKDTADFFMAGRQFNRWFMMFFAFGAGTSGNDAVGVSSKSYSSGMSGIWYQWLWLFATPFYWLIAPIFRRSRCLTTGDFFRQRYDNSVEGLYTIVGVLQLTLNMGVLLLGGSKMVEAVTGGAIPYHYAIFGMTILFVLYGIAGGLAAAIITDFVQGILTIILSFMLLPVALNAVGGFTGLRAQIEQQDGPVSVFSLVSPGEINLFHIVMFGLLALIGIVTQPHIMGVCAAGKNETDGSFGFAAGNLIKRFCTIPWMLVGICGIVMYPGLVGKETDLIYGMVARDLLPTVLPGLVGLFIAALLASIMSSCDAFMVSTAGLFTQNFYRRFVVKAASETHYVTVGRITALIVVVGALIFAFRVGEVPAGLEWFFKIQGLMGAAFWLGLFWRRTTVAGVWAGTLASFAVMYLTSAAWVQPWYQANLPEFMLWNGALRVSWSIFFYLSAGFLVAFVVSLFTPRVPEHKLNTFYTALRTPVTGPEPHLAPFEVPAGLPQLPPRKIINHPEWELHWPGRTGWIGFGVMWAWVVILIGIVYWIAGLGA